MTSSPTYAGVALDLPLFTAMTYGVPAALRDVIEPGHLVQVPFRNGSKTGIVITLQDQLEDPELADKIRPILDVLDRQPLLSATDIDFLQFVADYYFAPIGQVTKMALPSAIRNEGIKHYKLLRPTPPGKLPDGLDQALHPVVETLSADESTPVKALRERFDDLTYHALADLEDHNLVEVSYQEESSVREKTELFYSLVRRPEDGERVGPNQEILIDHLSHQDEPVSRKHLRDLVSSAYSSLRSLEKRGFVRSKEQEVYRDPFAEAQIIEPPEDLQLTDDQSKALTAINDAQRHRRFQPFVLHGVTGSGKTEVYIRAIQTALSLGRRALVLLPESSLTPQFVADFRGYFDDAIAVLHSGLTEAEKFDQWRRIKRSEVQIVIGARSALFAPIDDLGIIVVDEAHDTSFKQERGPRYNARDMALVRAKKEGAPVILGSATPGLESYHRARHTERMTYLGMPRRVAERPLPEVEIIDMRRGANTASARSTILSRPLLQAIDRTLDRGKQAILFLNRRGFSPCVLCESCGHRFECPNCDVSLTYHRHMEALRCHHCDFSLRMPETCPQCDHDGLGRRGTGTEKLEGHLNELYPHKTVARLDRDTSRGKGLRRTLGRFRRREIDLLVGTQMVTKGHDFPHVTLVGVVLADMSLNFPDFRAAERTFQLLTQVAGRAGRAEDRGRVVIQTYSPDHFSLTCAQQHDYATFSGLELQERRQPAYPPFAHLVAIKFEGAHEGKTIATARRYASAARRLFRQDQRFAQAITMLGPAMAPIARINNRSRWQLLLKSKNRRALRAFIASMLQTAGYFDRSSYGSRRASVRTIVDVDPVNLL